MLMEDPIRNRDGTPRKVKMVGNETLKAFCKRLVREKRYKEYSLAVKAMRAEFGFSEEDARAKVAQQYAPLYPAAPVPAETVLPTGEKAPTSWESMKWVADALGDMAEGDEVDKGTAPGRAALGLLKSAMDRPSWFHALWAAEGRRREDGGGDKKKEARKQIREMKRMLEETLVAAKRIELEAAAKAEERVNLEMELDSFEGENGTSEGDCDGVG